MPAQIVWGIDISKSAVKGVKLRRNRGVMQVITADIEPYAGEAEPGVDFSRDTRVWGAIKAFQERNRIGREKTFVAIPGVATFIRNVAIIPVGGKTPEELIEYEAREHMVLGLDAVVWDYEIFPPKDAVGKQREGLIFAVKRDSMRNFLLCFETAGIGVDDIQTSPLCLYALARHEEWIDGPTMLVDIGAESTDIVIVDGSEYWIRSVSVGGLDLTRAIAQQFNLPIEKAELVKQNVGQSARAREILGRILNDLKSLANEVAQSVSYYQREVGEVEIARMILLGGGVKMLGMKKLLGENLPSELYPVAAFENVDVPDVEETKALRSDPSAFAVALGAAIQAADKPASRVSLIPQKAAAKTFVSRKKPFALATVILLFVLLAGMFGFGKYEENRLNQLIAKSDETLRVVDGYLAQLKSARDTTAIMRSLDRLAAIGEKRNLWLCALDPIVKALPDNGGRRVSRNRQLWLVSIKAGIERKKIEIQPPASTAKGKKKTKKPEPIVKYVDQARVVLMGGVNFLGSESHVLSFVRGQLFDAISYSPFFRNAQIVGAEESHFLAPSKDNAALGPESRYLVFTIAAEVPLDVPLASLREKASEEKAKPKASPEK